MAYSSFPTEFNEGSLAGRRQDMNRKLISQNSSPFIKGLIDPTTGNILPGMPNAEQIGLLTGRQITADGQIESADAARGRKMSVLDPTQQTQATAMESNKQSASLYNPNTRTLDNSQLEAINSNPSKALIEALNSGDSLTYRHALTGLNQGQGQLFAQHQDNIYNSLHDGLGKDMSQNNPLEQKAFIQRKTNLYTTMKTIAEADPDKQQKMYQDLYPVISSIDPNAPKAFDQSYLEAGLITSGDKTLGLHRKFDNNNEIDKDFVGSDGVANFNNDNIKSFFRTRGYSEMEISDLTTPKAQRLTQEEATKQLEFQKKAYDVEKVKADIQKTQMDTAKTAKEITAKVEGSPLPKAVQTKVANELITLSDKQQQISQLKALSIDDDYFTFLGKANMTADALTEWAGLPQNAETKKKLGKYRQFEEQVQGLFNAERKDVTGAAMAFAETPQIEKAITNRSLTRSQYERSVYKLDFATRLEMRMKQRLLSEGLDSLQEMPQLVQPIYEQANKVYDDFEKQIAADPKKAKTLMTARDIIMDRLIAQVNQQGK